MSVAVAQSEVEILELTEIVGHHHELYLTMSVCFQMQEMEGNSPSQRFLPS